MHFRAVTRRHLLSVSPPFTIIPPPQYAARTQRPLPSFLPFPRLQEAERGPLGGIALCGAPHFLPQTSAAAAAAEGRGRKQEAAAAAAASSSLLPLITPDSAPGLCPLLRLLVLHVYHGHRTGGQRERSG